MSTVVLKFGGTCMRDHVEHVLQRIRDALQHHTRVVAVVSAIAGVTDLLIRGSVEETIALYHNRHPGGSTDEGVDPFEDASNDAVDDRLCRQMRETIRNFGVSDYLTSFGEKLSVDLVARRWAAATTGSPQTLVSTLVPTPPVQIVWADHGLVCMDEQGCLSCHPDGLAATGIVLVTGFCAKSIPSGKTVLLGRDGSDTSATFLANALACECTIYTDVDGMFNVDPRLCETARVLPHITVEEARELAFHGASVLHPRCLEYIGESGLTLRKVTDARGTHDGGTHVSRRWRETALSTCGGVESSITEQPWTGIAVLRDRVCVSIRSSSHINRPGFAADTFERLRHINIDMVAQSCTQTQISVVVRAHDAMDLQDAESSERLAVITVVGENMVRTPGVAAQLFRRLASVNIRCISQGSSELSISVAVSETDLSRALALLCAE